MPYHYRLKAWLAEALVKGQAAKVSAVDHRVGGSMRHVLVIAGIVFWVLWWAYQAPSPPLSSEPTPSLVSGDRGVKKSPNPEIVLNSAEQVEPVGLEGGFCGGVNPPGVRTPSLWRYLALGAAEPAQRRLLKSLRVTQGELPGQLVLDDTQTWSWVFRGLLAERRGLVSEAREHLEQARSLNPEDSALAFLAGRLAERDLDVQAAMDGYAVYLKTSPRDIAVAQRLARLEVHRDIVAEYSTLKDDGVTLVYWPELLSETAANELLHRSREIIDEAAELIGQAARPEVAVVLYPSRSELLATTCVPLWTGGIYDGVVRMALGTDSPRFDAVYRHELFHAEIDYAVPGRIPAWLNEGLAQFFAGEVPKRDVMLDRMLEHQTWVPFSSLEAQFKDLQEPSDARLAYRQSALMIDWVVDEEGETAIARGISHLVGGQDRDQVLSIMLGREDVSGRDLLDYLEER